MGEKIFVEDILPKKSPWGKKLDIKNKKYLIIISLIVLMFIIIWAYIALNSDSFFGKVSTIIPNSSQSSPQQGLNADANYCKSITGISFSGLNGILANSDNNHSLVSTRSQSAPFVLLYDWNTFIAAVANDTNNPTPESMVALLKSRQVVNVILNGANKQMITALQNSGINCYKSSKKISILMGEEIPSSAPLDTFPTTGPSSLSTGYCTRPDTNLTLSSLAGKTAVAATSSDLNSNISSKSERSPLFLVFDKNVFTGTIQNTFIDLNLFEQIDSNSVALEIVASLKSNSVSTVVLASPTLDMANALQANGIACIRKGGAIRNIAK